MHKISRRTLVWTASLILLLGSWRGHVALFMADKETPLEVYPVRTDLLPIADQKLLLEGITVREPTELTRILEDLLS